MLMNRLSFRGATNGISVWLTGVQSARVPAAANVGAMPANPATRRAIITGNRKLVTQGTKTNAARRDRAHLNANNVKTWLMTLRWHGFRRQDRRNL
jgi:hypothetical protein